MNKVAILVAVWAMAMVAVCYADTVKVGQRCGSCNYGSCESKEMNISSCELFFTPCTGVLLGSYFIEPETDSSDPILRRFNDSSCTDYIGAYVLACDTCNTWDSCGMFYQVCGGSFWLWTSAIIITICLCGCMAIGVGVFLYQLKTQSEADGDSNSSSSMANYGSTSSNNYENTDFAAAAAHSSTVVYQQAEAPAEQGFPAPYPYMQQGQQQNVQQSSS